MMQGVGAEVSEQRSVVLSTELARKTARRYLDETPDGWRVLFSPPRRTLDQNAAQWPYLDAFSKQLEWPVNGRMCKLTPEEWKDILSAAFQGETVRLAMGLNGGVVMLGMRTSKMSKRQFSEWYEFLRATAADRGVVVYEGEL